VTSEPRPPPSFTADHRSRQRLSRLLDFPASPNDAPGWHLERLVATPPERLRFELAGGNSSFVFHLRPPDTEQALLRRPGFAICYEGSGTTRAIEQFLEQVANSIGSHTLEELFALVEPDLLAADSSAPPEMAPAAVGGPIGDQAAGWRNFLAYDDFRNERTDLRWLDDTLILSLGDRECAFSHPLPDPAKWHIFDDPRLPLPGRPAPPAAPGPQLCTVELDQTDVILGSRARLEVAVQSVSRSNPDTELLMVNHLCTPVVIGDDLGALARRCRAETSCTVLAWSRAAKSRHSELEELLRQMRDEPRRSGGARTRDVNLFAFDPIFHDRELGPLLSAAGVTANVIPLPEVRMSALRRSSTSRLHLVPEHSPFLPALHRVLDAPGDRLVVVPSPYGKSGTRACLEATAAAVGAEQALEAAWQAQETGLAEAWAALRTKTREHTLALVGDAGQLERLADPQTYGVPLLPLIHEMGFGLRLLLHADDPVAQPALTARMHALPGQDDAAVRFFRDPRELTRLLADQGISAVYSDFRDDRRIAAAGKARFSMRTFEPGLHGALRTLRGLLGLCTLPFYRRYGRFLGRATGWHHD